MIAAIFAVIVAALALALLALARRALGLAPPCLGSWGAHEWMHERTGTGWRLRCRVCRRVTHGLRDVFPRTP